MNKKLVHYLAAGFLGLTAVLTFNHQVHTVQAKVPSTIRTVMYTSQAYDENGQKVDAKYPAFRRIEVDKKPLILDFEPYAPYYKISGKKQYIKANNIDGVKLSPINTAEEASQAAKQKTTKEVIEAAKKRAGN